MWLVVLFDLPVGTKKERKAASGFRLKLLDLGFEMTQLGRKASDQCKPAPVR